MLLRTLFVILNSTKSRDYRIQWSYDKGIHLFLKAISCESIHKLHLYFLLLYAAWLHGTATVRLGVTVQYAKDMKGHSHTITISKSALTGLWVITVLLLECFVFRFACSVSKANNHSLFTVWVGLFFLQQGKLHTRVTALRERQDQQSRQVLVSAVLNQGGRDADYSPAVCWLCGKGSKGLETWIYCTLTMATTINCLP